MCFTAHAVPHYIISNSLWHGPLSNFADRVGLYVLNYHEFLLTDFQHKDFIKFITVKFEKGYFFSIIYS